MTHEETERIAKAHLGMTAAVERAAGLWTVVTLVPVHHPQGGPPIRVDREVQGEGATAEEALMRAGVMLQHSRSPADSDGTYLASVDYFCRQDNCGKFIRQPVRADKSGAFGCVCPNCGGTMLGTALHPTGG